MNHPEMAERLEQAMALSGITGVSKLARRTKIDRGYLYKLANGEIGNPHKYLERLAEAMGVSPQWLGYGRGGPYDHERKSLRQGAFRTTVTVVPSEGGDYDIDISVPDIFNSQRHVPRDPELYRFIYLPEMNDYFPGNTLLTVEKKPRPEPGIYLAWYIINGKKKLGCYQAFYDECELKNTQKITVNNKTANQRGEAQLIGRVRNMDYWKVDETTDF
ncbi:helix-turn-helix domain-containing protein [Endozoicomonas sp.]|uniref:helix-turn-helix domain-containing protein n=1 Tax=Endozoicomonas sp. TaxID=1892382 RepID=UPI003AF672D2